MLLDDVEIVQKCLEIFEIGLESKQKKDDG